MRLLSFIILMMLFNPSDTLAQNANEEILNSTTTSSQALELKLKLFISGYYLKGGKMRPVLSNQSITHESNIVDTIQVLIHNNYYPYSILYSYDVLLQTNGYVKLNSEQLNGSYYISVRTRRGIETWTSHPILLSRKFVTYDFTTRPTQAYGNNMVEVENGVWAFFSGDVNQDGFIDDFDYTLITTSYDNFIFGFNRSDINGDGNVDILDKIFIEKLIDFNKDGNIDSSDYLFLKRHPELEIHIKRPMS